MAATLRNFEVDLGLEQLWKLKKNAVYALAYRKLSNGGYKKHAIFQVTLYFTGPFEIQPLKKFFQTGSYTVFLRAVISVS